MNVEFVNHTVKSNGVKTEYARVFVEVDGVREWVGEIELAQGVFRSRFHWRLTRKILLAIAEKWEAEHP